MIIALAPMDDITDCAYRIVAKEVFEKHNQDNQLYMFTEFMNANGYMENPQGVYKHLLKTEVETPLAAQIFGGNKENLVKTAIDIDQKYNFQRIELNIGCPSPKIIREGGGSGMMKDKKGTIETIKEINENISTPFSVKTRSGLNEEDKKAQMDFILEASKYCEMISIHGRTLSQGHSGEPDKNFVYQVKENLSDDTKILYNGGIKSYQEALETQENTDGVMIGQAAIGNPWILTPTEPSNKEVFDTINRHLDLLVATEIYFENYGKQGNSLNMPKLENLEKIISDFENFSGEIKNSIKATIEFRKHLFAYIKGIPASKSFKQQVIHTKEYKALKEEIYKFFEKLI